MGRVSRRGRMLRGALVTAALLVGLGVVGGLGYAMNLAGGLVIQVTDVVVRSHHTSPVQTAHVNAGLDQYGTTTTTATTTVATTTQAAATTQAASTTTTTAATTTVAATTTA